MKRRNFVNLSAASMGVLPVTFAFARGNNPDSSEFDFSQLPTHAVALKITHSLTRPNCTSLQASAYDNDNQIHRKEILFDGDTIYSQNGLQSWTFHPKKHMFLNFDALPQSCDGHVVFCSMEKNDHTIAVAKYDKGDIKLIGTADAGDFLQIFSAGNTDAPFLYHSSFQSFQPDDELSFLVTQGDRLCTVAMNSFGELRALFEVNLETALDPEQTHFYAQTDTVSGPHYNLTGEHKNTYFFQNEKGLTLCHIAENGLEFVTQFKTGPNAPAVLKNPERTFSWSFLPTDTYLYCLQNIGADKHSVLAFRTVQGILHFTLTKNTKTQSYTPQFAHLFGFQNEIHEGWSFKGRDTAAAVVGYSAQDSHDYVLFSDESNGWALYQLDHDNFGNFYFEKVVGRIVDEPTVTHQSHSFLYGDRLNQKSTTHATAAKRHQLRTRLFSTAYAQQKADNSVFLDLHHIPLSMGYSVVQLKIPPSTKNNLLSAQALHNSATQEPEIKIQKVFSSADQGIENWIPPEDQDWMRTFEKNYQESRHSYGTDYAAGYACGAQTADLICALNRNPKEKLDINSKEYQEVKKDLLEYLHENSGGQYMQGFEQGFQDQADQDHDKWQTNIIAGDLLFVGGIISSFLGFGTSVINILYEADGNPTELSVRSVPLCIFTFAIGGAMLSAAIDYRDQKPWFPLP